MNSFDTNTTLESLHKLDDFLSKSGWIGYDPYDIKSMPWITKIANAGSKNKFFEIIREGIYELILLFPKQTRQLFQIKPTCNAKGMGLICEAYLDLYQVHPDPAFLKKSKKALDWLLENKVSTDNGIGWGYPFDWQSKSFIPAHTPNGIVTTAVGAAIWHWYKFSSDDRYLDLSQKIASFLISLPRYVPSEDQICFAYTPMFQNYVHNLNLFIAEYLIKVGLEVGIEKYVSTGLKALNYTLAHQTDSGAFDYEGPPAPVRNHYDNYHTGFVLRMLYSIEKMQPSVKLSEALDKGYHYYINNLFEGPVPVYKVGKKYPIDIHSVAEAVNCLSELSPRYPEGLKQAEATLAFGIDQLQDKKGFFYHGIFKSRLLLGITFRSKIAHFRWGQSWMLKGFSIFAKHHLPLQNAIQNSDHSFGYSPIP